MARRRNMVLDSEDEDTPERALSEGVTLMDINKNDRHQNKKQDIAQSITPEDEHMIDASPPPPAARRHQYQAYT
ncbi:hypothetical protein SLS61_005301 [Didymella pomorum]